MRVSGRRGSVIFFITLGVCLVVLAVALNVGWILLNWRQVALLILGITVFLFIIAGLVLNTIFLVREIRRNEQHDSFINAVTHELRTPIASIRLYLETLKTRDVDAQKRADFYEMMLADSDRLLHTVDQVLLAGRASHMRRKANYTHIDLIALVRECLDLTKNRHHLDPGTLLFTTEFDDNNTAVVFGVEEELRAAITNLLDNAIKYSNQDIHVQVDVSSQDGRVVVRVIDQGIGIPSGHLKQLFKRFYRVPGSVLSQVKGTGLGLFIVRSIVKRHGGRTFAQSAGEGQGSTFTIQLPRVQNP